MTIASAAPLKTGHLVLIVEDDLLIALDVEGALIAAGEPVCGIATSQAAAIAMAVALHPDCAVVDITLGPGDGRQVAKVLFGQGVAVLFATGQCAEVQDLSGTGAYACLHKPYDADDVPRALIAVRAMQRGEDPGVLPDNMTVLQAA